MAEKFPYSVIPTEVDVNKWKNIFIIRPSRPPQPSVRFLTEYENRLRLRRFSDFGADTATRLTGIN